MPDHIISRRSNVFVGDRLYVNSFATSSTTYNLFVSGTGAFTSDLTVTGSLTVSSSNATQFLVGTSSLFVNSSGNVGIGTTSPQARLSLGNTSGITFYSLYDTVNGYYHGIGNNITSGTNVMNLMLYSNTTGVGRWSFAHVFTGNGTTTERFTMLIDATTSYLGIGEPSPTGKIDFGVNGGKMFAFKSTGSNQTYKIVGDSAGLKLFTGGVSSTTTGSIFFGGQRDDNGTENVKMTLVTNTGNLLIGPSVDAGYKLDVAGITRISATTGGNIPGLNLIVSSSDTGGAYGAIINHAQPAGAYYNEALRINVTGNPPYHNALTINTPAGGHAVRIFNVATGVDTQSNYNNVGIVIDSANGGHTFIRGFNNGIANGIQTFHYSDNTSTFDNSISLFRSRGTASINTLVSAGDMLGGIQFGTSTATSSAGDFVGQTNKAAAGIRSYAAAAPSASRVSADLRFYTTNNALSITEAMRLTSSGSLAIGKTTANATLDVSGSATITGSLSTSGSLTAQSIVLTNQNQVNNFNSSWDNYIAGSVNIGRTTSIGAGNGARLSISCDTGTNTTAFGVLSSGANLVYRVNSDGSFGYYDGSTGAGITYNLNNWNAAGVGDQIHSTSSLLRIVGQNKKVQIQPYGTNYSNQPVIIGNDLSRSEKFQVDGASYFSSGSILAAVAGNVLIGTTTDAGYKLDVNGTARISGSITITAGEIIGPNSYTAGGAFGLRVKNGIFGNNTDASVGSLDLRTGTGNISIGLAFGGVAGGQIDFINGGRMEPNFPAGFLVKENSVERFRLINEAVFNETGANYNFRIEGDNEPNLFFVKASTDNIGIGTSSPLAKLDVSGSGNFTNGLTVTGSLNISSGSVTLSTGSVTITSGSITMPNRPAFRVIGTSSSNISATTTISGSAVSIDYNQGNYYTASSGVFTAPVAGLYSVYMNLRCGSINAQQQAIMYKNNTTSSLMWEAPGNTGVAHFGVSGILNLAANDTLKIVVAVGSIQFDANDSYGAAYIG